MIKALSLWQPWATLVARQAKQFETRHWKTDYRGPLLICSAKKNSADIQEAIDYFQDYLCSNDWQCRLALEYKLGLFPLGYGLCIANLTDCKKMTPEFIKKQSELELEAGDWSEGRFAWKLENVYRIEPFPVKGQQGLFAVDYPNLIKTGAV